MAAAAQVRGALLEEVLLYLLERAGYRTVTRVDGDPTLKRGSAGIQVRGRGANHQIDGIADYLVQAPFSNPQRLLVEAKCLRPTEPVGLPIVRGLVGTYKDVSEFTAVDPRRRRQISKRRYHYQAALFSTTGYTSPAQDYAFAHDIYLIQLAYSQFFRPITDELYQFTDEVKKDRIRSMRRYLRDSLRGRPAPSFGEDLSALTLSLHALIRSARKLQFALLAVIGGFPVFLVPNEGVRADELESRITVRIRWHSRAWFLEEAESGKRLFSFDLPSQLFNRYADQGAFSPPQALALKEDLLTQMQASLVLGEELRILQFDLDREWLSKVRRNLEE